MWGIFLPHFPTTPPYHTSLPHLQEELEVVVGYFLLLHQPQLPDCNLIDYVWGAVEKDNNRTACNIKAQLIDRIKKAFESHQRDIMKAACDRFRRRVEALIDTKGFFFQWIFIWLL